MKLLARLFATIGLVMTMICIAGCNVMKVIWLMSPEHYIAANATMMLQMYIYADMIGLDMPNTGIIIREKLEEIKRIVAH